jgi:Protein of unknown function (DUF3040)
MAVPASTAAAMAAADAMSQPGVREPAWCAAAGCAVGVGLLRCLCARSRWNAELGERRQLQQIEQALRADDPRFASPVHAADRRVRYKRRGTGAALGFLIGAGLLHAGVVINVILIAVAGFVVMLACSMWAVTSSRRTTGTTGARPRQGPALWQETARRQGPALWQAGGIWADGAAGGALAASPAGRPLTPGCPLPSVLAGGGADVPGKGLGARRRHRGWRGACRPVERAGSPCGPRAGRHPHPAAAAPALTSPGPGRRGCAADRCASGGAARRGLAARPWWEQSWAGARPGVRCGRSRPPAERGCSGRAGVASGAVLHPRVA